MKPGLRVYGQYPVVRCPLRPLAYHRWLPTTGGSRFQRSSSSPPLTRSFRGDRKRDGSERSPNISILSRRVGSVCLMGIFD